MIDTELVTVQWGEFEATIPWAYVLPAHRVAWFIEVAESSIETYVVEMFALLHELVAPEKRAEVDLMEPVDVVNFIMAWLCASACRAAQLEGLA